MLANERDDVIMLPSRAAKDIARAMLPLLPRGEEEGSVFACARHKGKKLWAQWFHGNDWLSALEAAFTMMHTKGGNPTTVEIACSYHYRVPVELPGNKERGVTGVRLRANGDSYRMAPSEMIARNVNFTKALTLLLERAKVEEAKCELFDAHQFMLLPARGELVRLYRANRVVERATRPLIDEAARLMGEWMRRQVHSNGRLTYKYWPSSGKESDANNMIRQWMGTLCLVRQGAAEAERNLAHNMQQFYREEGEIGYILEGDKVKLGAAALAGLAILESPFKAQFAEEEAKLFAFTQKMWSEDGSFRTFYRPPERNDCQNFYPGETLLYWASRYAAKPDTALLKQIMQSVEYYQRWHKENINPAFVPWHTQAYFMVWQLTKDERLKDAIFAMNDWLLAFQQWDGAPLDARGRFYDPNTPDYGPPHASSTGVYLEGLADALRLAVTLNDKARVKAYMQVIMRALREVAQLQFKDEVDMFYVEKREKALGGMRTTQYDNTIRVDNVQHNLMALMKLLPEKDLWE